MGMGRRHTGLVAAAAAVALLLLASPRPGRLTPWLYSYADLGPMRRALLGSLAGWAGGPFGVGQTIAIATVIAVAVVVAMSVAVGRLATTPDGRLALDRALVGVALLVSSAGVPFVAVRVGHADHLAALLVLLAGIGIAARRSWGLAVASIGACAAVLAHESFAAIAVPWLAVYAFRCSEGRGGRRMASAFLVVAPSCVAAILVMARSPAIPAPRLVEHLQGLSDVPVSEYSVSLLYGGTADNLAFAWEFFRGGGDVAAWRGAIFLALAVVSVMPVLGVCWLALRNAQIRWHDLRLTDRLLYAASATPLALCPVAVDYGRWFAYSAVLATFTTLVVLRGQATEGDRVSWLLGAAAGLTLVAAVAAGPIEAQAVGWLHGYLGLW